MNQPNTEKLPAEQQQKESITVKLQSLRPTSKNMRYTFTLLHLGQIILYERILSSSKTLYKRLKYKDLSWRLKELTDSATLISSGILFHKIVILLEK